MRGKFLKILLAIIACITIPCGLVASGCATTSHTHTYGEATYSWEQNDTVCVATRVCTQNENHVESESVSTTLETENSPSYSQEGSGTMTATFANPAFETQTKSVVLPKKNALVSFEGARINGNHIVYVVPSQTTSVNFTDKISVQ